MASNSFLTILTQKRKWVGGLWVGQLQTLNYGVDCVAQGFEGGLVNAKSFLKSFGLSSECGYYSYMGL